MCQETGRGVVDLSPGRATKSLSQMTSFSKEQNKLPDSHRDCPVPASLLSDYWLKPPGCHAVENLGLGWFRPRTVIPSSGPRAATYQLLNHHRVRPHLHHKELRQIIVVVVIDVIIINL